MAENTPRSGGRGGFGGGRRRGGGGPGGEQRPMGTPLMAPAVSQPPLFTASLTTTRFDSFPISQNTIRALHEGLKYELCTQVQAASIPVFMQGGDVVTKARTGTGKTLAFLVPAVERMLRNRAGPGKVSILVISPTRELAAQIAVEAEAIGKFHGLHVQVMVGGTNINSDVSRLKSRVPDILVATPGRLNDHLENGAILTSALSNLRTLVFDEADRLLDMGFRPAIDAMLRSLPPKTTRQTVLFSATFPADIASLTEYALRPGYSMIDTVGKEATHDSTLIEQQFKVVPFEQHIAYLWAAVQAHRREDPAHKIIIFCVTARITQFFAELFQAMGQPVLEIHSRKSQPQRTKAADQFRNGSGVIMFTSDVSARGVDYPDVTMVVQVGQAASKEDYIHRVGRTARAGKTGRGLLLLCDFESGFVRKLQGVPIKDAAKLPNEETLLQEAEARVRQGLTRVDEDTKANAYRTWLGFYKTSVKQFGWDLPELVAQGNFYSQLIGCAEQPSFEAKTIGKMGLKGVPGLRIEARSGGGDGRQGGGRGQQQPRQQQQMQQPRQQQQQQQQPRQQQQQQQQQPRQQQQHQPQKPQHQPQPHHQPEQKRQKQQQQHSAYADAPVGWAPADGAPQHSARGGGGGGGRRGGRGGRGGGGRGGQSQATAMEL